MIDALQLVKSGQLLYQDAVGRDACGIGGIAGAHGQPSSEVMEKALVALRNLEHRGGVCGDIGDGAGLSCQIPQKFFRGELQRLGLADLLAESDRIAVGVFFLWETDAKRREQCLELIRKTLTSDSLEFLGFRDVPTNPDGLPKQSSDAAPKAIIHALFKVNEPAPMIENWMYRQRLTIRHELQRHGFTAYTVSLSSTMVGYKGLLTSEQFINFYPDLSNPEFETGIVFFHRRYSTNTFPNWRLAQPFRLTCHNGEINTIRTNRHAVEAYSLGMEAPLPGNQLLTQQMSDSGNLDEWLDYLVSDQGWSLMRAMRLAMPPVWDTETDFWGQDAVDIFTYCRRTYGSLCAWDGPAGMVGSDGRYLIGQVDRMGLRPVRWAADERGWLYIGSESGVFGIDPKTIVASGQLQPGQMIAVDTETGDRLDSQAIMEKVVAETREELGDIHERNARQIALVEGFNFTRQTEDIVGGMMTAREWSLEVVLQAVGWDFERVNFVKEMAKLSKEPLSSMGHDRVLTIFSSHHPTLFKYCQQTFAEVTNPPIDPYREGGAMSLVTYLGRTDLQTYRNNDGDELPVRQIELPSPIVNDEVIEEIRLNEPVGLRFLDATFRLEGGKDALRNSLIALRDEAEKAVHEGYHVLCVSDREAAKRGINPIPSLLALGTVHNYLCKQGLRNRCSIVVQSGDVQEGHDIAVLVGFGADGVHPYLMLHLVKEGLTWRHPETKQELRLDRHDALRNIFHALEDSLMKIMSKMGITTVEGYRGAMLFEAVGFGPELMEFLGDFPSRVGGIGLAELVEDAQWRVQKAEEIARKNAPIGRNKDYHAYNAKVRMALRNAVIESHPEPEMGGGEMVYTAPPLKKTLIPSSALG